MNVIRASRPAEDAAASASDLPLVQVRMLDSGLTTVLQPIDLRTIEIKKAAVKLDSSLTSIDSVAANSTIVSAGLLATRTCALNSGAPASCS